MRVAVLLLWALRLGPFRLRTRSRIVSEATAEEAPLLGLDCTRGHQAHAAGDATGTSCSDELVLPQLTLPQGELLLIQRALRTLLLSGPPGVDGRPAARSGGGSPLSRRTRLGASRRRCRRMAVVSVIVVLPYVYSSSVVSPLLALILVERPPPITPAGASARHGGVTRTIKYRNCDFSFFF